MIYLPLLLKPRPKRLSLLARKSRHDLLLPDGNRIRPISLLTSSLLSLLDSNFPGRSPMDMRIPPLEIKIMLGSTPLKSRMLVRRLAVAESPYKGLITLPL